MEVDGRVVGSLIGLVGGEVFVQANAAGLPGETAVRAAGWALGLAVLGSVVVHLRSSPTAPPPPSRQGLRVYGVSVIALAVSVPVGAAALRAVGHDELTRAWVVLVVGLHLLPFARAFGQPFFRPLAWSLVTVALVGGAATVAGFEDGPGWTGVLAGGVLLVAALVGLRRRDRHLLSPGRA
ncbi:hypothetical protein [Nocardioides sp. YIM 152315]|uniref:hypothetical protein n=1 Tax=Nocardioides sp. YIM 152315 TaxID=3031760 RepID=UPI0023DA42B7|nr:hypothetical protein [Nocardioides sp. YIM 152315]MDF1606054.1 hypothetical protein [Nocardioides sp. YIM 152315]